MKEENQKKEKKNKIQSIVKRQNIILNKLENECNTKGVILKIDEYCMTQDKTLNWDKSYALM